MREFFEWYSEMLGEGFARLIFGLWFITIAVVAVLLIVNYIFSGISLYTIGKRRGLKAYGLAWVPFGTTWLLGSIADQFDRKKKGRDRHSRTWLLIGDIVVTALFVLFMVFFYMCFSKLMKEAISGDMTNMNVVTELFTSIILMYASLIPLIVFSVFYYIALYKVYKSCSPKASGWLLALAILINFSGLQISIPLFCLRNKDIGFIDEDPEKVAAEKKRLALYN